EHIDIVGYKHRRWVFGAKWRHLLQYVYEFRCYRIEKDLGVNVDYRHEHLRGEIGGDNFLKSLTKRRKVIRIQRKPRGVLVASKLFQQIAACADGLIKIEPVYTSRRACQLIV